MKYFNLFDIFAAPLAGALTLVMFIGCFSPELSIKKPTSATPPAVAATDSDRDIPIAAPPPALSTETIGSPLNLLLPYSLCRETDRYMLETRVFELVIAPLRFQNSTRQGTVMIDPGHGGGDSGAPGTFAPEKVLNLSVALKLQKALERRGFRVLLTRDSDVFVSLSDRVKAADKSEADIFIAIHHDAAPNRSARGYSAFAPRSCSAYPTSSVVLATAIQSEIIKLPHVINRGVKFADFRVLYVNMPSVLLELGFISNAEDERLIVNPSRQEAEAEAIATGVFNYCRLDISE